MRPFLSGLAIVNRLRPFLSGLAIVNRLRPFLSGLAIVNRLRPITFRWKQDGTADLGLGAEDVAKVEPLLTFRNHEGEIEGVKYNQLNVVLINAIREQQAQIERQERRIEELKKLVCRSRKHAAVCRSGRR